MLIYTNFLTMISIPYKYIYDLENLNEISLTKKEDFSIYLNMEDLTNADYTHAKKICKSFLKKQVSTMIFIIKVMHY